jgi:methyl-accepting chemotaxis protein
VLSAQLDDTARHVEESVVRVCTSFSSIARRTKESAAHAASAAGRAGGSDGAQVTARSTIAGLLGRMDQVRRAADQAVDTLRRIEGIATRVDRIQRSLDDVDAVAHSLRILALNARIEAVRAGERGHAFGVVAAETGRQAEAVGATAKSVRGMVDALWHEVKASTEQMRGGLVQSKADDLGRAADLSREEGARALDALAGSQAEMQALVAGAAANSQRLAADIEDAMTALQFQDSVNQQLEHVASALKEARAALDAGDGARADDLLDRLRARATMQSERRVLDRVTNRTPVDAGDSAPGSVELF